MEQKLIWWPCPAKLNLFLHINGRLPNGYHQLQSLFQLLDYGDNLAFDVTAKSEITLQTPIEGVPNEDNLIVKAARLLQQESGFSGGCDIWLEKKLPMGGGIGGGSSNAATALVALNHLWGCGFSLNKLADLGLSLGADVPIFVHGKSAFAEGVGEKIFPVVLETRYFLVAYPGCHVSTAEVFGDPDLPRNTAKIEWQDYRFEKTHNDCEKLVCNRYPKVANLLHRLVEYAPSRMTGTGACLFSVFDCAEKAQKLMEKLPENCLGFVASGVNHSPLHQQLERVTKTHDSK